MLLKLLCPFVSLSRVIPTPFGPSFFCWSIFQYFTFSSSLRLSHNTSLLPWCDPQKGWDCLPALSKKGADVTADSLITTSDSFTMWPIWTSAVLVTWVICIQMLQRDLGVQSPCILTSASLGGFLDTVIEGDSMCYWWIDQKYPFSIQNNIPSVIHTPGNVFYFHHSEVLVILRYPYSSSSSHSLSLGSFHGIESLCPHWI